MIMKRTVYQILERLLDRKSTSRLRRRFIPAIILLAIAMSTAAEA